MKILTYPSDPRDQAVAVPDQDAAWTASRLFRQQLAASEQIQALALLIGNTHMLYEGWPALTEPWSVHVRAAELAVRACSEEVQICASRCLEEYAVARYPDLEARLRSCDSTPELRVTHIKRYARELAAVHRYHLLHEAGRSDLEMQQFERDEEHANGPVD